MDVNPNYFDNPNFSSSSTMMLTFVLVLWFGKLNYIPISQLHILLISKCTHANTLNRDGIMLSIVIVWMLVDVFFSPFSSA